MTKKRLTRSSQRRCKDESLNPYNAHKEKQPETALTGDFQDQEHCMLWLLARGFLHWQICNCGIVLASGSRQEAESSVWAAGKSHLNLKHSGEPVEHGKWQQWETTSFRGWRPQSGDLTCYPEMFAVCWGLRSEVFQGDCWSMSSPQTMIPWWSSMCTPMILTGRPWACEE